MEINKPKSIEQYVADSLYEAKDQIIKKGIEGVKERIAQEMCWTIASRIKEDINKLFEDKEVKEKMSEEIRKVKICLIETFAAELQKVIPTIAIELATTLQKRAIKNLTEDNYSMRELYKKLFE